MHYLVKRNRKRRAQWQRPTVERLRLHWWVAAKTTLALKFAKTMHRRWNRKKHPNRKERKPVERCSTPTQWHQRNQRRPALGHATKTTAMKWFGTFGSFNLINKFLMNTFWFVCRLTKCITTFWTTTHGARQRAPRTWMLVSKCN